MEVYKEIDASTLGEKLDSCEKSPINEVITVFESHRGDPIESIGVNLGDVESYTSFRITKTHPRLSSFTLYLTELSDGGTQRVSIEVYNRKYDYYILPESEIFTGGRAEEMVVVVNKPNKQQIEIFRFNV